jgi:hypothetical protein
MTTASKKRCGELVRLCSGLDFFPRDQAIIDLLVGTLQRVSANDTHAERIINSWLERERKSPMVSDIVNLAGQVPAGSGRKVNPSCDMCEGLGYMIVHGHHGFTGATPCPNKCLPPLEGERKPDARITRRFYDDQFAGAGNRRAAFIDKSSKGSRTRTSDADKGSMRRITHEDFERLKLAPQQQERSS